MSRAAIAAMLLLAGCRSAEKTAREQLGSEADCISSSNTMAYCKVGPNHYLCDMNRCVIVGAEHAERVMLMLDADRQADEDMMMMLLLVQ